MKAKYYLARLLCGTLQFSDNGWTSYKDAVEVRKRQVNPYQWIIVVNPEIPKGVRGFDIEKIEKEQRVTIEYLYTVFKKATDELGKIID